MPNLFYDLPTELQTSIYEFDPTFRIIFQKVLEQVAPQVIYRKVKYNYLEYYFIYDAKRNISYILDNLLVPDYLSIRFNFDNIMFQDWLQTHEAVKLDSVPLHMCLSLESFEEKMNI